MPFFVLITAFVTRALHFGAIFVPATIFIVREDPSTEGGAHIPGVILEQEVLPGDLWRGGTCLPRGDSLP